MVWRKLVWPVVLWAATCAAVRAAEAPPTRIKDITVVAGRTGERLLGYGLVVGLEGTGDSTKSVFTAQALANMLEHFEVKVTPTDLATKNVAAVVATATLPGAVRVGDRVDVTVASVSDAQSLYGGVLLPTPMRANDAQVWAMAQGPVSIGGLSAGAGGQKSQQNHPLTARLVGGGTVMLASAPKLQTDMIPLTLLQPDYTTARRIAEAINKKLGSDLAKAVAAESVEVKVPPDRAGDLVGLIAEIECLPVVSDTPARVVVNERTGTVIIGGDVRVLPVAVAQGSLTVTVRRRTEVSQPPVAAEATTVLTPPGGVAVPQAAPPPGTPGAGASPPSGPKAAGASPSPPGGTPPAAPAGRTGPGGGALAGLPGPRTVTTSRTDLKAMEAPASLMQIESQTRLSDLVEALNALGVKPRDLIAVLQALKEANALQAELVLM